jgi:tryptophan synthase alpha chain
VSHVTSAVTEAFGKAATDNRAALVGYLPAGFPSVAGAIEAALAMAQAGADVIEVGLPYSDPLMDGPVIAEAVHRALAAGTRVTDVLPTVETVVPPRVPVLVMTYWNPVDRYVRAFARDLAAAGGSGLITRTSPSKRRAPGWTPPPSTTWTGSSWSRPAQPTSESP